MPLYSFVTTPPLLLEQPSVVERAGNINKVLPPQPPPSIESVVKSIIMTTPKDATEVVSKNRLKRRLLRNISRAMRKKLTTTTKPATPKVNESMTDSDDSESETQEVLKHQLFTTKRTIDQSHEGTILKQAQETLPSLLPLCESEIEALNDNDYEQVGRLFLRQDSNSTIRSQDSLSQRLAEVDSVARAPVVIDNSPFAFKDDGSESVKIFTDDTSVSTGRQPRRKKFNVRFADEHGGALEIHHWTLTMYSEEENDWMRAIVLLLSPKKKKFEFLHVSYNLLEKTSISDILAQLPGMSTDEALKEQNYVGLIRKKGGRELINTVSIQSYYLDKNEVLVGVVEGHHGKAMSRMAEPLLSNRKIMKAVTRSKSKRINVKQLQAIPGKKKATDSKKFFPLRRQGELADDDAAAAPPRQVKHQEDDEEENELDQSFDAIPEMFSTIEKAAYFASDSNKDKITLTRFVNAGILTAVVCGVQRTLGRAVKR